MQIIRGDRIDVVINAPTARALFGRPQFFDPDRPTRDPNDVERDARQNPRAVRFNCPICHVTTANEEAFWLHAEPCVAKWWKTLDVKYRVFAGARPGGG